MGDYLFHIRGFAYRTINTLPARLKYYGCMVLINADGAIKKVYWFVFNVFIHDILLFCLRLSVKLFGPGPLLRFLKFQFAVANLRLKCLVFLFKHANESLEFVNSWEVGDVP